MNTLIFWCPSIQIGESLTEEPDWLGQALGYAGRKDLAEAELPPGLVVLEGLLAEEALEEDSKEVASLAVWGGQLKV